MSNPFADFREGMREGFDRAAYEAGMRDAWQAAQDSARVSDETAQRVTAAPPQREGAATLLAPVAAPAEPRKGGKGMRVAALVCATLVVLAYVGKPAAPATATTPPPAAPAATVTVTAPAAPASTTAPAPASDAPTASTAPATGTLPAMAQCEAENGSTPGQTFPCVWSGKDRGNGTGRTYVLHGPQH